MGAFEKPSDIRRRVEGLHEISLGLAQNNMWVSRVQKFHDAAHNGEVAYVESPLEPTLVYDQHYFSVVSTSGLLIAGRMRRGTPGIVQPLEGAYGIMTESVPYGNRSMWHAALWEREANAAPLELYIDMPSTAQPVLNMVEGETAANQENIDVAIRKVRDKAIKRASTRLEIGKSARRLLRAGNIEEDVVDTAIVLREIETAREYKIFSDALLPEWYTSQEVQEEIDMSK